MLNQRNNERIPLFELGGFVFIFISNRQWNMVKLLRVVDESPEAIFI
jgi:hypothetical protein